MKLRLCYASTQAVEKALQESLIHVAELRLALRIGGKSYYLYIHYGENGEQRHCEPLHLYAPPMFPKPRSSASRQRQKVLRV